MLEQIQSNTTQSLSNRPMFGQYVEFQTDLSPDACLDRLMGLANRPVEEALTPANLTTWRGQDAHEFRICVERSLPAAFTNAQFVGVIGREGQQGKTVVRGKFTPSTAHLISLAVLLILFLAGVFYAPFLIMIVLIIGILSTWEIYADYHGLEAHIETALR